MKKPKITVVVPVYNVEKYLDRCLDSIMNQTYTDFEIVLVDDGSKDLSGVKCEEWAQRDDRITVIHKENAGLGYARNTGLEHALGEYIAFVDSDDYIVNDTFEKVLKRIEETKADICYFGCIDVWDERKSFGVPPKKILYEGNETAEYVKEILGPAPESTAFLFGGVSAWSGIVRNEFLKENCIQFPSERECLCEDIFYNLRVCKNAKRIAIEPSCLYCYCHNGNSLTTSYRKDRFEAALQMYVDLKEMFNDYTKVNADEIKERIGRSLMQNLIVCIKQEVAYAKNNGIAHMQAKLHELCRNKIVKDVMEIYPIKKMPIKQRVLFWGIKSDNIWLLATLMKIRLSK